MTTERTHEQPVMTPQQIDQFLHQPLVAVLSWITSKGDVASSPVWYEYRDGRLWVSSSSAFAKVRAMRRNPAVSVCVQDPAPPYRYVTMRASAEVREEPDAARALDARLAQRYLGRTAGRYYTQTVAPTYPGEPRIITLTPKSMSSMDGSAGMSPVVLFAMSAVRAVGL